MTTSSKALLTPLGSLYKHHNEFSPDHLFEQQAFTFLNLSPVWLPETFPLLCVNKYNTNYFIKSTSYRILKVNNINNSGLCFYLFFDKSVLNYQVFRSA